MPAGVSKSVHHPGKAHPGLPREGRLSFVVMMVVEDHEVIEVAKKAFLPCRGKFFLHSDCGDRGGAQRKSVCANHPTPLSSSPERESITAGEFRPSPRALLSAVAAV